MKKLDIIKVFFSPLTAAADTLIQKINWEAANITINTAAQLKEFASKVNGGNSMRGKTITLGNNIYLDGSLYNQWTPIRDFEGTFDGNGYIVGGVYIDNDEDYQGLFGYLDATATIKNLGVVDSYIKGYLHIGGLAGDNYGKIENCYATGNIMGGLMVGGLVGDNFGKIKNCYATGNVTANYGSVGGLVGMNYSKAVIKNCYAAGIVALLRGKNYTVGGLVGAKLNGGGHIIQCHYDGDLSGLNDKGKGEPKTTTEMKMKSVYTKKTSLYDEWNFINIWGIDDGNDYPYLRAFSNKVKSISSMTPAGDMQAADYLDYDGQSERCG